jgi:hypothetical protein
MRQKESTKAYFLRAEARDPLFVRSSLQAGVEIIHPIAREQIQELSRSRRNVSDCCSHCDPSHTAF